MTRHVHQWVPLFRRPVKDANMGLAFCLKRYSRWNRCSVCNAHGLRKHSGRVMRTNGIFDDARSKEAEEWNRMVDGEECAALARLRETKGDDA